MSSRTPEPVKVVARYADGRVLKGTTTNFSAEREMFLLHPAGAGPTDPVETVRLADLKAVFFVRDLDGDAARSDSQEFLNQPAGKAIAVTFTDGEVLVGASWTYEVARDAFFLFPADPRSNNLRVYVVMSAVTSVERVPAQHLPKYASVA
jgi:hypothetical protein